MTSHTNTATLHRPTVRATAAILGPVLHPTILRQPHSAPSQSPTQWRSFCQTPLVTHHLLPAPTDTSILYPSPSTSDLPPPTAGVTSVPQHHPPTPPPSIHQDGPADLWFCSLLHHLPFPNHILHSKMVPSVMPSYPAVVHPPPSNTSFLESQLPSIQHPPCLHPPPPSSSTVFP